MSIADLKFSDDVEQPGAVYETQRLTDGAAGSSGRAAFEVETAEHKPRGGRTVDSDSITAPKLLVPALLLLALLLPQLPPARAACRSVLLPLHAFTTTLASCSSCPSACYFRHPLLLQPAGTMQRSTQSQRLWVLASW